MVYERRNKILQLLSQDRMIKVKDLIRMFDVSLETIRRDLEYLEKNGYINRIHGGAVAKHMSGREPEYSLREIKNYEQKRGIARAAVDLVEDGNTLAIDIGTTCLEFAKCLKGMKKVTVLTNAIPIAVELADDPDMRVIMLGGNVRGGDYATSGFLPEENMRRFNVDKFFIGIGGLTLESGFTDYIVEEANLRRHIIARSQASIALVDYSKFGVTAMNTVCDIEDMNIMVTDRLADKLMLAKIRERGVKVIVADAE